MSVYIRLLHGVKVRVSWRGLRRAIGPRAARLHIGAGRTGVSIGAGPWSVYKPLRRRRGKEVSSR